MKIAHDSEGVVRLSGSGPFPDEFNGAALTSVELDAEQEAAFLGLPADRSGVIFSGGGFTAIPARPSRFHERQGNQWVLPQDKVSEAHNAPLNAQIAELEALNMAPRFSREAILVGILKDHMRDYGVSSSVALSELTSVGGPRYNAGFVKLYALDNQIKAIRAQRLP